MHRALPCAPHCLAAFALLLCLPSCCEGLPTLGLSTTLSAEQTPAVREALWRVRAWELDDRAGPMDGPGSGGWRLPAGTFRIVAPSPVDGVEIQVSLDRSRRGDQLSVWGIAPAGTRRTGGLGAALQSQVDWVYAELRDACPSLPPLDQTRRWNDFYRGRPGTGLLSPLRLLGCLLLAGLAPVVVLATGSTLKRRADKRWWDAREAARDR